MLLTLNFTQMSENKKQTSDKQQNGNDFIADVIGSDSLNVFDLNNNEIKEGCVIKHNDNLFLIRFSKNQKQWVARASEGMNWRDFDWIKRTGKYCEIVANIHSDKWVWERWQHCL